MEKKLFEVGADIDVEALMSRLRESAMQRTTAVVNAPTTKERDQKALKTLQPQRLSQEIQAGSLFVDVINWIPLRAQGTKGSLEFRVKKLLKWLVHWNTKGQAEFNRSVTRSLGLIAQDLQIGQGNFATVEDLLRDIVAQSSGLERRMNRELGKMRRNMQGELGAAVALLGDDLNRKAGETRLLTEQLNGFERDATDRLAALEKLNSLLTERIRDLESKAAEDLPKVDRMIEESAQQLRADLGGDAATSQEEMNRTVQQLLEETRSNLAEFRIRILRAERLARNAQPAMNAAPVNGHYRSDVKPAPRDHGTNGKDEPATGTTMPGEHPFGPTFDYFLFEHTHRGSLSDIKRRQSTYLDLFLDKQNVVDLGCGRGEFVELLTENGIKVIGVDSSEDMVDFCRDRGLKVVHADMFEFLGSLADGELDGIFIAQVVEHVSPEQILKLVSLCAEKLGPQGVIVIETVNANCPTALGNFYQDPTHVRPVPAEMLRFMLEQASFQVEYLRFTSPLPGNDAREVLDFASDLTYEVAFYQDYAIVAVKREDNAHTA